MANRTVSVGLRLLVGDYVGAAEKAASATDKIGNSATRSAAQHKKGMDSIRLGAGVAAAAGALGLHKIIGASMDFDKAMSGVAAVSDASGASLQQLRKAALDAGRDTAFSASQAAEAEGELAKAGVSTGDILGGALTGALNLASAGQLDLGNAATISANAMNLFGLQGKDVGMIADTLAAGANKSAADVDQLAQAMAQGGQVAASMGLDLQDTVGALSMFADQGLKGSDAGTSLKTALQMLVNPSSQAAEMMKRVGINAFDASGNFVGLDGLAGQLQKRMSGLTQEQRGQALATIFGSDAIRVANILFKEGEAGVKEYTAAVNDQGAAQRMASKQMDNLSGDVEQLSGSLETALIKQGSGANSVLRGITQSATGAVNAFSDLPGPLQMTATGLLVAATAGTGAIAAFGTLAPKVRTAREELRELGTVGQRTDKILGGIGKGAAIGGGIVVGIEAMSFAIGQLQDVLVDTPPMVNELTQSMLRAREWSDVSKTLGENVEDLGLKIRHIADPSTTQQINNVFAGVIGQAPKSLREAREEVGALDDALAQLVSQGNGDEAGRQFTLIAQAALAGGASVDQVREALPKYREALAGVSNENTLAAGTQDKHAAAARGATGALKDEASAADQLKSKLDALNGTALDAGEADNRFRSSLLDLTSSIHDHGRSLDINKAKTNDQKRAVLANRDAIFSAIRAAQAHAQAVAQESGSVDKGTATFNVHIAALRRTLIQSGATKAQVDALLASYARTPPVKQTKVTAPGATTAKKQTDDLFSAVRRLPPSDQVLVNVNIKGHDVTFSSAGTRTGGGAGGSRAFASGGWVRGQWMGPRADNVAAWVNPKEFILQAPTATKIERQAPGFLDALNSGQIDIGGDPGVMRAGIGRPLHFALGGSVPAVQSWIQAQDPKPYIWGGTGPYGWDCSGLAGGAWAKLTGRDPYRRYMTTGSIGAQAASMGLSPGLGFFSIGVTPGIGHMVGQLGGLKFEARSTRSGIIVGPAATSPASMARHYHLTSMGTAFGGGLTSQQISQVVGMMRPRIIDAIFRELGVRKFDDGGWLPPHSTTLAINGTDRYEPVGPPQSRFTPAGGMPRDALAAEIRALGALLRGRAGGPLVNIERNEMVDPVSVDLLAHRVSFLEGATAGGFG